MRKLLMIRVITFIALMLSVVAAPASNIACNGDYYNNRRPEISDSIFRMIPWGKTVVSDCLSRSDSNPIHKDVKVTEAGKLAETIGSDINEIDSIAVSGPINDSDFNTLWSATFYGKLSVINLENAEIENESVPANAFFHADEQTDDTGIYVIGLKRIILPDNIKSIGGGAFVYAVRLEEINLPKGLRELGSYTFSDCKSLKTSPLQVPEGVTEIPPMCFKDCHSLDEVVLPSTIKKIGQGAFFQAKLKHINLPEGLTTLDHHAFYASGLEEVSLPSTCLDFLGSGQFALNYNLKKFSIHSPIQVIPDAFLYGDFNLTDLNLPPTVRIIEFQALWGCWSLPELVLPEGVDMIRTGAFAYCRAVKKLVLPSTVTYIESYAFHYFNSLEAIYCSAPVPPMCDENSANAYGYTAPTFGPTPEDTPNDIPVYVPVGTSSLYAAAKGWNYFTNFVETEEFPPASVPEISIRKTSEDNEIYDLSGRKVIMPVPGQIYIQSGQKIMFRP